MLHHARRYVPVPDPEAHETAGNLDGRAHKKTGHKRSIMWRAT